MRKIETRKHCEVHCAGAGWKLKQRRETEQIKCNLAIQREKLTARALNEQKGKYRLGRSKKFMKLQKEIKTVQEMGREDETETITESE
jgi:hypothetical protein